MCFRFGEALSIPLPINLGRMTYGPDGRSLYGFDGSLEQPRRGLLRIEFNPVRVTSVPGSEGLRMVNGFSVSPAQDKVALSAQYKTANSSSCGIFEFNIQSGVVRRVAENPSCDYRESWNSLSLSPDGRRLVAYRRGGLELIDMADGTIRSIGEQYIAGAWSPDGRWLAALEGEGQNRTILLDAKSLAKIRVLGTSNVEWSPDSRFLLGSRGGHCIPELASLVAIDIQSGKESVISSSSCKVDVNTTGWVSSAVR